VSSWHSWFQWRTMVERSSRYFALPYLAPVGCHFATLCDEWLYARSELCPESVARVKKRKRSRLDGSDRRWSLSGCCLLCDDRLDQDLDAAIGAPTCAGVVACNRFGLTSSVSDHTRCIHVSGQEIVFHGLGAPLGQIPIVLRASGVVGIADDCQRSLS